MISPLGYPILIGFAVADAAGSLVITATQAAADINLAAQQRANAERVTAAQMEAIVQAYESRLAQTRIVPAFDRALTEARTKMAEVLKRAREESAIFASENSGARLASAACSDPRQQPNQLVSDINKGLEEMGRLSASIVKDMAEASTSAASCAGQNATRARQAYDRARKDLDMLERVGLDARDDIRSVLRFFATVKAGRAAVVEAEKRIEALEALIPVAREAESAIRLAAADYRAELQAQRSGVTAVFVGLNNLREAFPPDPPPHIASALKRLDEAYTREASNALTEDRLNALELQAGDDVATVEGLYRLAGEQFDNLRACGQETGEVPDTLGKDLARVGDEINNVFKQARSAVEAGKDIPAKIDDCLKRSTTNDPVAICQRLGSEILSIFTSPSPRHHVDDDDPSEDESVWVDAVKQARAVAQRVDDIIRTW